MSKKESFFIEEFPYGSAVYQNACALRHTFLRQPLGLELTAADVADDAEQFHFGLFALEKETRLLIGGCIGKPVESEDGKTIQFRQVVVDATWRSRGLGCRLMLETEKLLAQRGYTQFILYARDEAAPFYERCGYQKCGETMDILGLPHSCMKKQGIEERRE